MKTLILWARLPSYLAGFCKSLQSQPNHEIVVAGLAQGPLTNSAAPFSERLYDELSTIRMDENEINSDRFIHDLIRLHCPDAMIISGWQYPPYRRLYRNEEFRTIPKVLCCDNTWRGTIKQRLGRYLLAPMFRRVSKVWVPGKRGQFLMSKWGVDQSQIVEGMYNIDFEFISQFKPDHEKATTSDESGKFLFVGQLIERKGFHLLVEAYRQYRKLVDDPWSLVVCGRGDLESRCRDEGIEYRGFIDGAELPKVLAEVDAFILPSLYDSWGVVLAEAACAGLPADFDRFLWGLR